MVMNPNLKESPYAMKALFKPLLSSSVLAYTSAEALFFVLFIICSLYEM